MTDSLRETSMWLPPMELDPGCAARIVGESAAATVAPAVVSSAADRVSPESAGSVAARSSTAESSSPDVAGRLRGALSWASVILKPGHGVMKLMLAALGALLLVALGFDAADLLQRSFASSAALGMVVLVLVAMVTGTALKVALDEIVNLRRIKHIERLRAEADRLAHSVGHGEASAFVEDLLRFYGGRSDLVVSFQALNKSVSDAHNNQEVIQVVERQVLTAIDQRAYRLVLNGARDTAVATALSPSAAIDLAIVFWRNTKMVREIAELYGARPGPIGSISLIRRLIANLAVAGVAEGAHHVAVDALGGSLAAAVSARLGQGVINGLLTARLGVTAMHLCRPVGFSPDHQPSLKRIRSELMSVSKQVL
ncbi:putative membrane protein [Azospirillaceae bacterium]